MSGIENGDLPAGAEPQADQYGVRWQGQIVAPALQIEMRGGFVDPYATTLNPYAELKEAT